MPGSVRNPLSRGCHKLIREGATLAESPLDLWTPLQGILKFALEARASEPNISGSAADLKTPKVSLAGNQRKIIIAMGYDPVSLDAIAARTGLSVFELQTELLALEFAGVIRTESGRYSLQKEAPLQGH